MRLAGTKSNARPPESWIVSSAVTPEASRWNCVSASGPPVETLTKGPLNVGVETA